MRRAWSIEHRAGGDNCEFRSLNCEFEKAQGRLEKGEVNENYKSKQITMTEVLVFRFQFLIRLGGL
jgi:hypothetical protein